LPLIIALPDCYLGIRPRSDCGRALAAQPLFRRACQRAGRDTGGVVGDRADFFVSHAGADRAWAEWVAWQLTDAGYTVVLDVWDWAAGQNFMTAISDALDRCDRVVALFSAAYFDRSRYTREEWAAAALHVPGTGEGRLVPVRVEEVPADQVPAVLRPVLYRDLFGVGEDQARLVLLEAVAGPQRPGGKPVFPAHGARGGSRLGELGPRVPGPMPAVWNIPARNPGFTGRDGLLLAVRERRLAGENAVVQAFQGMGGVGKTQLAAEYAHRFAGTYDLAWWVNSEQAALIGDQVAALGAVLGCVQPGAGIEVVRAAVLGELRQRDRWLLVFDNAEDPADVRPWLPGGGHVLITSREHRWAEIAAPVDVDVLARAESLAILQDGVTGLGAADAEQLAVGLGDLPLAITQAAGFMAETGITSAQYLELLRTQAGQLLDQAAPGSAYPRSLAATARLIADRLDREDPAAAQLASLCSFLAPEPIPEDLFTSAPAELPGQLAARAGNPLAWRQTLAQLSRQSLAQIGQRGLQLHRLTQAILRDRLTPDQAAATRERSEAIPAARDPSDAGNPATWPRWAQLMPHLLATDLAATDNPNLRWMACNACWYLLARGEARTCHDLASNLRQHWRGRLGDDHQHMLVAAAYLARALLDMGRYAEARDLDQDTLNRRRRVLGEDHPDTLASASSLAADLHLLGEVDNDC
jgi:TIR domain/Tetratricopeptide repeat/NB-ARC domain